MATGRAGVTPGERSSALNEDARSKNSIIQEKSVTSLRSPAPVGDRSQDGGTTNGRAAVRSLFTGDARETAITSHRSWPVSGDVEGQPEERHVGTGARSTNWDRSSGRLTDVTRVGAEPGVESHVQEKDASKRANTTERRIKWDRAFPPGTDVTRAGVGREAGSHAPERSV